MMRTIAYDQITCLSFVFVFVFWLVKANFNSIPSRVSRTAYRDLFNTKTNLKSALLLRQNIGPLLAQYFTSPSNTILILSHLNHLHSTFLNTHENPHTHPRLSVKNLEHASHRRLTIHHLMRQKSKRTLQDPIRNLKPCHPGGLEDPILHWSKEPSNFVMCLQELSVVRHHCVQRMARLMASWRICQAERRRKSIETTSWGKVMSWSTVMATRVKPYERHIMSFGSLRRLRVPCSGYLGIWERSLSAVIGSTSFSRLRRMALCKILRSCQ